MPEACRNVLASRGGYILIMALWIPSALYADATFGRWAQGVVSLVTWALLAAVFLAVDGHERRQLIVVVLVATTFEILFSIVWGLYVYRFQNLPLYVPPGHGLIYLLAVRLSQLGPMHRSRRVTSGLVTVAVCAWVTGALVLPDHPDLVGLCLLPALLYCLWRARRWHVYAGAFVATTALEIVGTQFGNWRWADSVPGVGLSQGNPPSAIAAGYCLLDAIVLFLSSRFWLARMPLARRAPGPEPATEAAS